MHDLGEKAVLEPDKAGGRAPAVPPPPPWAGEDANTPVPPKPAYRFQGFPAPDLPALRRLGELKQWLVWNYEWNARGKKWNKIPRNWGSGRKCSATNPDNWAFLEHAIKSAAHFKFSGIGFALSPDDKLTGIDLDNCRDPETGKLEPWVQEIIDLGETYAEVSPSGKGIRLFAEGKIDRAMKCDAAGVEMYATGRYLTVTGQHIPGSGIDITPADRTFVFLVPRIDQFKDDAKKEKRRVKTLMADARRSNSNHDRFSNSGFFRNVNDAALKHLDKLAPAIFGDKAEYQPATRGWRVSSVSLDRNLEEDISLHPDGIHDFGEEEGRTAVDLVRRWTAKTTPLEAALWICETLGIDPGSLGWRAPSSGAVAAPAGLQRAYDPIVSQDAVAMRFAREANGRLLYCHHQGRWFSWTGTFWQRDDTRQAFQFARLLAREESRRLDEDQIAAVRKASFASGVKKFAQCDPVFAVTSDYWDKDPFLLGTPDGPIDLRTGQLRGADPHEGITRLTAVAPADTADSPRFQAFLNEATGGDEELIRFLQQIGGYCLTGDIREHVLIFIYGDGGTGKTTFLRVLTDLLNSYAITAPMDVFTASNSDRHPTDLAMMRGARLVASSETEEGRAWAETRIKSLTGGDPITARFMRQDFFTYQPQFKLLIAGNHKPQLRHVDEAMRRRFRIVPFKIKPEKPDPELLEKLKQEWPGILRWIIDGCLDWQANGLIRPASVQGETETYFSEQDTFSQWLAEDCDCEPGNHYKTTTSADLFQSWKNYALKAGEEPGSRKTFASALEKRGIANRRGSGGTRLYEGVHLKPQLQRGDIGENL